MNKHKVIIDGETVDIIVEKGIAWRVLNDGSQESLTYGQSGQVIEQLLKRIDDFYDIHDMQMESLQKVLSK